MILGDTVDDQIFQALNMKPGCRYMIVHWNDSWNMLKHRTINERLALSLQLLRTCYIPMVISNKPKPWIIVIICFLLENGSLMDALLMYHKKQGLSRRRSWPSRAEVELQGFGIPRKKATTTRRSSKSDVFDGVSYTTRCLLCVWQMYNHSFVMLDSKVLVFFLFGVFWFALFWVCIRWHFGSMQT